MNNLVDINNLSVRINNEQDPKTVLNNVSFQIGFNEIVALAGASGSGKTMASLALLGLLPEKAEILSGHILVNGKTIDINNKSSFETIRGKTVSMIFQEPHAVLNPLLKAGRQLSNVIQTGIHQDKKGITEKCHYYLSIVGFSDPDEIYHAYPHQLSGGMAQRVVIALALSCEPLLLIADEPTTALDATSQLEILKLLKKLQEDLKFSMLLISHDTKVLNTLAGRIIKINEGRIIEEV